MAQKIERFEDILAWQKARLLNVEAYRVFKNCRDYSFCDQLKRATVSIMNNIAEGFERKSNKEFSQFLFIAKGSAGEVRSMLILAQDLGYVTEKEFAILFELAEEISKMLSSFISSLRRGS